MHAKCYRPLYKSFFNVVLCRLLYRLSQVEQKGPIDPALQTRQVELIGSKRLSHDLKA